MPNQYMPQSIGTEAEYCNSKVSCVVGSRPVECRNWSNGRLQHLLGATQANPSSTELSLALTGSSALVPIRASMSLPIHHVARQASMVESGDNALDMLQQMCIVRVSVWA